MRRAAALLPDLPRPAWRLLAGDAVWAVGGGMTLPYLFVLLHRDRGLGAGTAGGALACMAAMGFAGAPLGGTLADRIGPRRTLLAGLLAIAAASGAVAAGQGAGPLIAGMAGLGLGYAVVTTARDALFAVLAGPDRRAAAFAVHHATMNVGLSVGGVLASVLLTLFGTGATGVLFAAQVVAVLAYAAVARTVADVRPASGAPAGRGGYRLVLRDGALRRVLAVAALLFGAGYAQYTAVFPAYATGDGGLPASALGPIMAANALTVVFAQLVVTRWVAAWRRSRTLALAALTWAVAWTMVLGAGQLGGGTAAVAAFGAAMVVFGLGETMLSPALMPLVNDLAPDALRGRYNGACGLAATAGWTVGPLVAGAALAADLGGSFVAVLAVVCAGTAIAAMRLEPAGSSGRIPAARLAGASV